MATSPEPLADADAATNGAALDELQRRVQALEDAVARLEDPRTLEERLEERMEERITTRLGQLPAALPPAALPLAAPAPPEPAPPVRVSLAEMALTAAGWGGRWSSWLLVDMWREGRTLIRLIFDPRYAMAWTTRLVVLVVLPLILTSHWWLALLLCGFPWIDGLRGVLVACVNLVLAFALYKALSREVRRYDQQTQGAGQGAGGS
jgi:hypothetical protein